MMYIMEKLVDIFAGTVVVLIMGLLLLGIVSGIYMLVTDTKLPSTTAYEECIADGQKPYVCYSMIYGRGHK